MKWWVCWSTGRRRSILARRGAADPGARRLGVGADRGDGAVEALSGREGMEVEESVREEIALALASGGGATPVVLPPALDPPWVNNWFASP